MVHVLVVKEGLDTPVSFTPSTTTELLQLVACSHRFGPGTLETDDCVVVEGALALHDGIRLKWYPKPEGPAAGQSLMQQEPQQSAVESKAFSRVGSTEAEQLLQRLGISEIDGNLLDSVQVPSTPCDAFDYTRYANENEGTPALLAHHQAQLERLGVSFGRDGYQMYDLHSKAAPYKIYGSSKMYQGGVDGCIAPFGLAVSSAPMQCRVVYEHKQTRQKGAYRVADAGKMPFSAAFKGQAIVALLGAYAYNSYPLVLDLTDGVTHHVLRLIGYELYEWTDLSPSQAYHLQAEFLNDPQASQYLTNRSLRLESIPEELQAPIRKLQALVGPSSALKDQLDSVVPSIPCGAERVRAAYEIIQEWVDCDQVALPASVQRMFS